MAKLFRVIALSEEIHGERALRMLREIKDTDTNLKDSFLLETRIAGVAYDHFVELAEEIGDIAASNIFSNSRDVEDIHAKLYKKAINHLIGERETTYLCVPGVRLCVRWSLARGLSGMFRTQGTVCEI